MLRKALITITAIAAMAVAEVVLVASVVTSVVLVLLTAELGEEVVRA